MTGRQSEVFTRTAGDQRHRCKAGSLTRAGRIAVLAAVPVLLAACADEPEVVDEVRSIKTITVTSVNAGQLRRFSGIVRAAERSVLSFEVGGIVLSVNVDIGVNVEEGQLLAELDKEPYELEVQKAEAELVTARAKVKNKRADYEREKSIFSKGAGSQRSLDQAEFALSEAEAGMDYVVSKLNLTKRDLRKTVLYAPYNGSIGLRLVEPFVEVRSGERIFEIDATGDKEIEVGIPETTVNLLSVGMSTLVSFPTLPGERTKGQVSYVGTLAGDGNSFPVKVGLLNPPADVRSGMTAEVTFELQRAAFVSGFAVPAQAILPAIEPNRGYVFVYQADTSTVKKTPIRFRAVKDNMIVVSDGISAGDIVSVAGVSFLSDGQKVELMADPSEPEPETLTVG